MRVIAITTEKGGVGKTSTATSMASILHEKGYKVLLIDADKQCNSTDSYQGQIEDTATIYDVLLSDDPIPIEAAIQKTKFGDLIAGDPLMQETVNRLTPPREHKLKRGLDELRKKNLYDFVIIDTRPDYDKLLSSIMMATDDLIIPMEPNWFAISGFSIYYQRVCEFQEYVNPDLNIAGILKVKYAKNQTPSKELDEFLTDCDVNVFKTPIRNSIIITKSQNEHVPLIHFDKKSAIAKDYYKFVDEYLANIKNK